MDHPHDRVVPVHDVLVVLRAESRLRQLGLHERQQTHRLLELAALVIEQFRVRRRLGQHQSNVDRPAVSRHHLGVHVHLGDVVVVDVAGDGAHHRQGERLCHLIGQCFQDPVPGRQVEFEHRPVLQHDPDRTLDQHRR